MFTILPKMATLKGADGKPLELSGTHYFKLEDEYDTSKPTFASQIVENSFKRFPKLTDKDKKLIREWAFSYNSNKSASDIESKVSGLSPTGVIAIKYINNKIPSTDINNCVIDRLELSNKDQKVNMTRRNVATSRMAALLGVGHLVAKSETAEIVDNATGKTYRGNLMEQAQGDRSGKESLVNVRKGKSLISDFQNGCPDVEMTASGGFQRDLCSLQVFDNICGQIDRHSGNYLVSQKGEKGEITGLQGIDNDGAFGLNEDCHFVHDVSNARSAYDINTGKMALPYLDKNFAERIKALEPDVVRYALRDLLTEKEIDTTIIRLDKVKKAIDTMDKSQLLSDDEWNDDTAQTLIDQAWNANQESNVQFNSSDNVNQRMAKNNATLLKEKYFGGFMLKSLPIRDFNIGRVGLDAPALLRRKQKMQSK